MAHPNRPLRLLVRSDSQGTSLGEGVVDPADERLWPAVLARLLTEAGVSVEVRNASSAGLTIAQALRGFEADPLVHRPMGAADVVVVALGINDWWPLARPRWVADRMDRARPLVVRRALRKAYKKARPTMLRWTKGGFRPTPPGAARRHLEQLTRTLRADGRHVVLMTPFPVRSPKNPLLDGNTWEASDAVRAAADAVGVPIVDCRELFQPIEWETISIDHIHVNPAGHEAIAAAVAGALRSAGLLDAPSSGGDGETLHVQPGGPPRVLWRVDPSVLAVGPAVVDAFRAASGEGWYVENGAGTVDVHDELRSIEHDPLVRDEVAAADVMVLCPAFPPRLTAWTRERYSELVDVLRSRVGLVLVRPSHGTAAGLVTQVGRRFDVPVIDADPPAIAGAASAQLAGRR